MKFLGFIFCLVFSMKVSAEIYHKGFRLPSQAKRNEAVFSPGKLSAPLPVSHDLRALGLVNPIKDQGACGSCWAFASTAVLESMAAKKFGKLVSLSEQELVSCATEYGVDGCDGGNSAGAWAHTAHSPQVSEADYPYVSGKSRKTESCKKMPQGKQLVSSSAAYYSVSKETDIKIALLEGAPVAIAIATDSCFMNYKAGILTPQNCPCTGPVDHLVAVVGYGVEAGVEYWIVRNSWSEAWGEKGYVRFATGHNQCQMMSYATVPDTVSVTKNFPKI